MRSTLAGVFALSALCLAAAHAGDAPAARKPREALQPFNELIGSWRGTGTRPENRNDFWKETVTWEWQLKGDDAWITLSFDKGKHFEKGTLRYVPETDRFKLTLQTTDKQLLEFVGKLERRVLILERTDGLAKQTQRLMVTMLHETRFLYRSDVRPEGRVSFTPQYQVGCTREGVAFATGGDGRPECIVSGGLGTMKVSYKGKDYYVCCSGCRDAFKDDPEKFIKEYEAKKKAK